MSDLKALIREIPDFPKPGILFRDITTLLANGPGLREAVGQIAELFTAADRIRQRNQFLDQRNEPAIAVRGSGHPFRVFRRVAGG